MNFGLKNMFYKYSQDYNEWFQGEKEADEKQAELVCARRDSAVVQAVVSSMEEDFLLTVTDEPLFWKAGPLKIGRIALEAPEALRAEMKLVGLIPDDNGVLKSDILLDDSFVHVEKRKIQQVWVELHAGEDVAPGMYECKLRLYTHTQFEDEQLVEELHFSVTVTNHTLPKPDDYRFQLNLWQHNSNIARKYQVKLWSDEHFAIMDHYVRSLAQLGQKTLTLVVSEIPWSGQFSIYDREPSDLFEYSIVQVRKRADGTYAYDFSSLDRYIELGEKHGITGDIELIGLLNIWQYDKVGYGAPITDHPDGVRVRYFDEQSGTFKFFRNSEQLRAYVQALETHLKNKGWIDRVRILADEPADIELFEKRLSLLRDMAPSFSYKVAFNHADFMQKNISGVKGYVAILDCITSEFDKIETLKPGLSGIFNYYVCCFPHKPNTFVGSPSLESRLIPWLVEKFGLDGFTRWNYTVWPDRPLERISYRPSIWKAGDTNFVYPGASGKPMLSLRYKWLQRGIRDFELMQQLKEQGRQDDVNRVLDAVFRFEQPSDLHWSSNKRADQLYSLEQSDYDMLLRL